jgi:hypothetical protein
MRSTDVPEIAKIESTGSRCCSPECLRRPLWFCRSIPLLVVGAMVGCWSLSAAALETATLRRDGRTIEVPGKLLVEAQDGGLLMLARDGVLWAIQPDEKVSLRRDDRPFEPLSSEELAEKLLAELPEGFEVHRTAHYLILHDTSRSYAYWCGSLFERLYGAFRNFWERKGMELSEPEFPLVAIVFAEKRMYADFCEDEVGEAAASILGYFSLRTNRMNMYDLTGIEKLTRLHDREPNLAAIDRILARRDAQRTVATIVHEATHQIAFNSGLHARYSDCPVWLSEGVAMYFETPDLGSSKGWRTIGAVNRPRLVQFRKYLPRRPADSLRTLLTDDDRFRNSRLSLDAYAEAWALTYFLLRTRTEEYLDYLTVVSEKKPLHWDTPQTRIEEFEEHFGDWESVDKAFVRYVQRMR